MEAPVIKCKHCGDEIKKEKAIYVNAAGKKVPNPSCESCFSRSLREPLPDDSEGKTYKHLRTGNWH